MTIPFSPNPEQINVSSVPATQAEVQVEYTLRTKSDAIERTSQSNRLKDLAKDPWLRTTGNRHANSGTEIPSSEQTKSARILVVGAGYGGLLFAVRLLQSGFSLGDILLVDAAGGFGGTWYWNRYPGLMCDIESYIYMPLLEETGHIPSRKYVPGEELRGHAERIAEKWKLHTQTLFRTTISCLTWDENKTQWIATASQSNSESQESNSFAISADFAILANGTLSKPKIPDLPGVDDFAGHVFHTARWDYDYTGGSPSIPVMDRLKTKRVGVIGTGSTAVQVIPQLARWAGELTVFQRTPVAVGLQENQETDRIWWSEEIDKVGPGWQRKRCENFNAFITDTRQEKLEEVMKEDQVQDGWTRFPSFSAAIGGAYNLQPDFLQLVVKVDEERQRTARQHIKTTVHDPATAEALLNSTYSWCKRPCFHQGYYETYNLPHVKLVNTAGEGVTELTRGGVLLDGKEYELDLIVLATGYDIGSLCPADRAQISVRGRQGHLMSQKWAAGPATFHGVMTRDFPNLFFPGTSQAGVTANQSYMFDRAAEHVSYIIRQAYNHVAAGFANPKVCVEPSQEAEDWWTMETVARAKAFAATKICSSGSYTISARSGGSGNVEKTARHMPWGEGMASYVKILEEWRKKGDMDGLEIAWKGT